MDIRDQTLIDLSERQFGLVTLAQAQDAGLTHNALLHRRRKGEWERVSARVLRRSGSPPTEAQAAMAAVLDVGPGAYLSHGSAAAVWGVPGYRLMPHHVIEVRDGAPRRTDLAVVHRPRLLPSPFATVVDGLPVVRPALLVLQLAAEVHVGRLARVVDGLWSRRLVSGRSLRQELEPLMHRGRAGTAALREVLDERDDGYVPPASGLEARAVEVLAGADLPVLRRQVDLGDDERWCGRVDLVGAELPVVVEVQSERYHTSLTDREADAARRARLEAAGFVVIEVWDHDVWHRPAIVVSAVRQAFWEARARRANAA